MIDSQTIMLCISIREEASLQHLVRGEFNTWYDIGGIEGCLFYSLNVVFRVAIQFEITQSEKIIGRILAGDDSGASSGQRSRVDLTAPPKKGQDGKCCPW